MSSLPGSNGSPIALRRGGADHSGSAPPEANQAALNSWANASLTSNTSK